MQLKRAKYPLKYPLKCPLGSTPWKYPLERRRKETWTNISSYFAVLLPPPEAQRDENDARSSTARSTRICAVVRSHLVIMPAGSKTELVISATESCSWYAFSAEMTDVYE